MATTIEVKDKNLIYLQTIFLMMVGLTGSLYILVVYSFNVLFLIPLFGFLPVFAKKPLFRLNWVDSEQQEKKYYFIGVVICVVIMTILYGRLIW